MERYSFQTAWSGHTEACGSRCSTPLRPNAHASRRGQELSKLREAGLELPDLLAIWHLMTGAAMPKWQIPNLTALRNHRLSVQVVTESLKTTFGGDITANKKDVDRVPAHYQGRSRGKGGQRVDDAWEEEDGAYYEDEGDPHDDYDDACYEEGDGHE